MPLSLLRLLAQETLYAGVVGFTHHRLLIDRKTNPSGHTERRQTAMMLTQGATLELDSLSISSHCFYHAGMSGNSALAVPEWTILHQVPTWRSDTIL